MGKMGLGIVLLGMGLMAFFERLEADIGVLI
jgi:hypothetical protein